MARPAVNAPTMRARATEAEGHLQIENREIQMRTAMARTKVTTRVAAKGEEEGIAGIRAAVKGEGKEIAGTRAAARKVENKRATS